MKKCSKCNNSAFNSEQFCGTCGTKMDIKTPKRCPHCREVVADCERFCTNCGQSLIGPRIINVTQDAEIIEPPRSIEDKTSKPKPWYEKIFR